MGRLILKKCQKVFRNKQDRGHADTHDCIKDPIAATKNPATKCDGIVNSEALFFLYYTTKQGIFQVFSFL